MTARTDEIEADIDATRRRVSEDIEELRDRLSPGQLLDQVMTYMRHGPAEYAGDFAGNLSRTVRNNPLPVLLLGVGATWLMMADSRPHHRERRYEGYAGREDYGDYEDYEEYESYGERPSAYDPDLRVGEMGPYQTSEGYPFATEPPAGEAAASRSGLEREGPEGEPGTAARTAEAARERAERMGGAARSHGEAGRSRAADAAAAARERAERGTAGARYGAQRAAGRARHGLDSAGRRTGRGARYAGDRAVGFFEDQPVALAALGIAAGALLGSIMPQTGAEHRYLGPARDRMRDQAVSGAREELEKGRQVAEAGREAGQREAEAQGLTPEGLTERAKQAEDAAVKVAEAAEKGAEAEREKQRGRR